MVCGDHAPRIDHDSGVNSFASAQAVPFAPTASAPHHLQILACSPPSCRLSKGTIVSKDKTSSILWYLSCLRVLFRSALTPKFSPLKRRLLPTADSRDRKTASSKSKARYRWTIAANRAAAPVSDLSRHPSMDGKFEHFKPIRRFG